MPTIDFLWNEWDDNLFQETDDHGVVTSYVTMPGKHGEVLYDQQGNRFTYYHYDGNGSTHKLTGANQAVTKTYIFTGIGELIASPGLGSTPFAYKGAAGYYTNPVTNDIYVRARTYEPTKGRWLSKDPLGFVDGPNLYGAYFVPNGVDPLGWLDGLILPGTVAAVAGTAGTPVVVTVGAGVLVGAGGVGVGYCVGTVTTGPLTKLICDWWIPTTIPAPKTNPLPKPVPRPPRPRGDDGDEWGEVCCVYRKRTDDLIDREDTYCWYPIKHSISNCCDEDRGGYDLIDIYAGKCGPDGHK